MMAAEPLVDWVDFVNSKRSDSLPPLSPDHKADNALVQGYFEYYGLDFEQRYNGLEHFFGAFESGGFQIAGHVYRLPEAIGTAYIYHGFFDHVGLYNHLINFCLARGYSVVAYDLPGHGLSSGERASIERFEQYVEVLRDAFKVMAPFALPENKIAIAQSTGCAILMTHLLSANTPVFEKVALMAPLVRPAGWWWGRPVHNLIGGRIDSLPRNWSKNSADVQFLQWLKEEDRLQHDRLPMSWVGALKNWEPQFHNLGSSDQRILIVQGKQDGTVAWRFNMKAILEHFPAAEVFYLDRARHHLVKESEELRHQIWLRLAHYLSA